MTNEPVYDGDVVNLGYLNTRLEGTNKLLLTKTQNYGSQPSPPYRVNDTYMNGTDIYICKVERLIGNFNAADWEKASNYTDNQLAESKNKVFNIQPVPPYKLGDLWTGGPNGELRRCVFTRTTGSYNESDWEMATTYDSTQTTVEGGLVTTGTIQVIQGGTVAAGMTGNSSGNNAIRFWAGSTLANRTNAPFKVTQGGAMTANSGSIGGWTINANGLTNGRVFIRNDGYTTIYTAADIFIIKAIMYGESWAAVTPGTAEFNRYDLNGDGVINSQDLLLLRQMLLG